MATSLILITEDDANQRLLYERTFTREGYRVQGASNGRDALAMAKKDPPDLVVMDINMPSMDGLDVISRLLAEDRNLPIVIHTAYKEYKSNYTSWSADAYIMKKSDLTELCSTVRRLLMERGKPVPEAPAAGAEVSEDAARS